MPHAMQGQGVFVCFCCAVPVVHEKRRRGDELAARGGQPPQQASAPRAGAAPRGRPSPTRILPQRARDSPVRFVPAADRAKQREKVIREAEMDQVAAAAGERAVLAELRAIGLSLAPPYHRRHRLARSAGGQNLKGGQPIKKRNARSKVPPYQPQRKRPARAARARRATSEPAC